jgi:hypothetical protein
VHYIFIRLLILGEWVKEDRRRVVVGGSDGEVAMVHCCHIPVWDVVFGLAKDNERAGEEGGGTKTKRKEEEKEEKVDAGGGGGGGGALRGCGGNPQAILHSAKHLRTERNGPMSSDGATIHSNYINIKKHIICLMNCH